MARVYGALLIGGALAIIPLGVGGIPLFKLLFFALAALMGVTGLCGTRPRSLARQIRTAEAGAPRGLVPHLVALREGRMAQGFLFTFFAAVFLSPLWSAAPILSIVGVEPRFEGVIAYGVFFGLALMAMGAARSGREQSLLRAIAWSNAGVVLYGLLQVVGKDPFSGWWDAEVFLGRVFSTVGQPNMLGQFLVLTAPLAALAVWRRSGTNSLSHHSASSSWPRGWERVRVRGFPIIAGVVLVLNFVVLLATGSRAGMIGAIVAGGFYFLSLALPPRGRGFCLPLCVVFLILVLAFLPLAFRRFSLPGEWDRSLSGRITIWRDAVSMIRARPMGWGIETTGIIFPRFQRAPLAAYESLTTSVDRAHSKPLDLLLTVGPLGVFSYYTFLLLLFLRGFRAWRNGRDPLVLAGMAGVAGVSASLLFGFESVVVHAFFWLVCGMLVGLPLPAGEGRGEGLPIQSLRRTFFFFSIVLLAIIFFLLLSLSSRFTASRAERAFGSGNLAVAVHLYDKAARSAPWDRALLIRFIETALLARERAADAATQGAVDSVLAKRFRHFERLTGGSDPLLPSLRAWHAALHGERKEALAFLDDAGSRAPFSISRLRITGKVAELLGDTVIGEAIRTELTRMLPPWRDDPADPRRRILWKENPWLEEFMPSPFQGRGEGEGY